MTTREVPPGSWGQVLLEEVLFLAAKQVGGEPHSPSVAVDLTVQISSDAEQDRIEIAVSSVTGDVVVTHLPRPD